jgi:hypothetical protein
MRLRCALLLISRDVDHDSGDPAFVTHRFERASTLGVMLKGIYRQ